MNEIGTIIIIIISQRRKSRHQGTEVKKLAQKIWWKYCVFMDENGTVRSVETVLRKGRRG
jgi:hypothetical protein